MRPPPCRPQTIHHSLKQKRDDAGRNNETTPDCCAMRLEAKSKRLLMAASKENSLLCPKIGERGSAAFASGIFAGTSTGRALVRFARSQTPFCGTPGRCKLETIWLGL